MQSCREEKRLCGANGSGMQYRKVGEMWGLWVGVGLICWLGVSLIVGIVIGRYLSKRAITYEQIDD